MTQAPLASFSTTAARPTLLGSWHRSGELVKLSVGALPWEGVGMPATAVIPASREVSHTAGARRPETASLPQGGPSCRLAGSTLLGSGAEGTETGSIRPAHLYLLRPGLQLLPLLQVDLPHTGQQVVRGHEDPGAQEKRKDVRSLKKRRRKKKKRERGQSVGQAWRGPSPAAPLGPAGSQAQHPMHQPWFLHCSLQLGCPPPLPLQPKSYPSCKTQVSPLRSSSRRPP